MQKFLVIEPENCTGCRTCEAVCSLFHEQRCNPAESRIGVVKYEAGLYIPVTCQNCNSMPCGVVCPTNAISRNEEIGLVAVNYDLCVGCRMCLVVCPFGAMGSDVCGEGVIKCDLCGGDPLCVEFCETKALRFLDAAEWGASKRRDAAGKLSQLLEKFTGTLGYE